MNTAAPSRKKLLSLVLTLVFMLTCLPAALAVDLNVDAGFYFKQSRGGTCTLAFFCEAFSSTLYMELNIHDKIFPTVLFPVLFSPAITVIPSSLIDACLILEKC